VHQQLGTLEIHGGVRFSIGAFNTEEQVDAAIHAVAEIVRWAAARRKRQATLTAS
jgi:cysteine sulfinate desulfinase/cysteine desulfurase-like protein